MSQIQKELGHLEHWLLRLPDDEHSSSSAPIHTSSSSSSSTDKEPEWTVLASSIQQLTRQLESQQTLLHTIADRLTALESVKEIHIETDNQPWMDDITTPYVHDENKSEVSDSDTNIYLVCKHDQESVVQEPVVKQPVVEEPVVEEPVAEEPVVQEQVVQEPVAEEPVVEEPVVEEPVAEEPVVQEPVVQEPVVQEESPNTVKEPETKMEQEEVQEEEEEEEEQEEEEDGVELEEITYQNVTYYRDPDMMVYSIDEDGQPSDEPIGYWKEKTKSVAFYKKK